MAVHALQGESPFLVAVKTPYVHTTRAAWRQSFIALFWLLALAEMTLCPRHATSRVDGQ